MKIGEPDMRKNMRIESGIIAVVSILLLLVTSAAAIQGSSFLTETVTDITCQGTVIESDSLSYQRYCYNNTVTEGCWYHPSPGGVNGSALENASQSRLQYDEHTNAYHGYVEYKKTTRTDGLNAPNLQVDKKVGFIADQSLTSALDSTENVGMFAATNSSRGGGHGAGALCVWAQNACIPPLCGVIVAGSQLRDVKQVDAHTKTTAQMTESPQLHHEINAGGPTIGGSSTYGVGTVSAGMHVDVREGNSCANTAHPPLGSHLRYDLKSTAKGKWSAFGRSMTYKAQIPAIQVPGRYPIFPY